MLPKKFEEFITDAVNNQEFKYIKKKNLSMMVLPEFKLLFENTSKISSKCCIINPFKGSHGKFPGVIKNTNKRRSIVFNQIEINHKKEALTLELMEKDDKILTLEIRIKEFQEISKENEKNLSKLSKLYELGVIDENGEIIKNENE